MRILTRPHPTFGDTTLHPAGTIQDMMLFQLYRAWAAANPTFTRLCEGRFQITRREWRILATVVQNAPLSSTALAEAAQLDATRTSRAITTLCEKGWLLRERDKRDARKVLIAVSDEGRRLHDALMPRVAELNAMLTEDLNTEELASLRRMLRKITERAEQMQRADLVTERLHRGHPARRPKKADKVPNTQP